MYMALRKNVPRHILAPSAVACDILHLRASAHLRHAVLFIPHQSGAVHIHGRKFDSRSQLLYALFYNWKEVQDYPVLVWNFIAQHRKKQ